jgi:hypothetical protein
MVKTIFTEKLMSIHKEYEDLLGRKKEEMLTLINQSLENLSKRKSTGDKIVDAILRKYCPTHPVTDFKSSEELVDAIKRTSDFREVLNDCRGKSIGAHKIKLGQKQEGHGVFTEDHTYGLTLSSIEYFGIISKEGNTMLSNDSRIFINTGGRYIREIEDDSEARERFQPAKVCRGNMPYVLGMNYLIGKKADDYFGRGMKRKLKRTE